MRRRMGTEDKLKKSEIDARKNRWRSFWFCKDDSVWSYRGAETVREQNLIDSTNDVYGKEWFPIPSSDCLYYQRYNVAWKRYWDSSIPVKRNRVGMLVMDINKPYFILVQNYGNCWSIPKGGREPGDKTDFDTALREFEEETGLFNLIKEEDDRSRVIVKFGGTTHVLFLIKKDFNDFELKENLIHIDPEVTGIGKLSLDCIKFLYDKDMLDKTTQKLFKLYFPDEFK